LVAGWGRGIGVVKLYARLEFPISGW